LENGDHKDLFIATQGPLKNTIESFWLTLINNESSLIIALSKSTEDGRVKNKYKL
jgi:protein tyrosine phosphatase